MKYNIMVIITNLKYKNIFIKNRKNVQQIFRNF